MLALVLGVLLVEAALLLWRRPRPAVAPLSSSLYNLGAGACLVLAMAARSHATHWGWVAASLTAAFAFHVLDLLARRPS
ncbi:MAG: hypothetical protein AAFX85_05565 [Pseudomonadota bacterium]